jgi:chitodextrinase
LGEDKVSDINTGGMDCSVTSPSTPTDDNVSNVVFSNIKVMNLATSVSADPKVSNAVPATEAPINTVHSLSAEDDSSNKAPANMKWVFWEPPAYIKPKGPDRTQAASSFYILYFIF